MTELNDQTGAGASPRSAEAEVSVSRPEQTIDAPVQDGAQELRDEAKVERQAGIEDRADNVAAPGQTAERGRQTEVLEDAAPDEPLTSER